MATRKNGLIVTEKAYAYTPGLKVKSSTTVIKERILPILGDVLVKEGEIVNYDTIIARAQSRGEPIVLKVAYDLNVEPDELENFMIKKVGEKVEENELLAQYKAFFGLINRLVNSPITGIITSISNTTGHVIIEKLPVQVLVKAYISGKVTKIIPNKGVIVETLHAAFIQGIFGLGGETHGKIKMAVKSNDEVLTEEHILPDDKGMILIGGSLITIEALRMAIKTGVSCIVAGGLYHKDIMSLMGEEIGVAITGEEDLGITLIITEGFGKMNMSQRTFNLFKHYNGYLASVNGTTQIRAGVLRPEIIIPHQESFEKVTADELISGMIPGTSVRIIRQPFFGAIGKVASLPVELKEIETRSHVRVLNVEIDNGEIVTVPRANVEIIEE